MKRSLKKYDNGGKTKRPVFPGKLNNRVVSDNTSVQRPTIQQQDVRLKTPQEVKKANRENFQKRIGVKPTYNVQELTDFGTPEPGLEDASLEALDALSLASGVGYLGKKGLQLGAKELANVLKSKPKFNSEIDWAKWNKEIPSNQPLLQEYNAIEKATKANGNWMKNPDGSAFQGTPEQFVQQQSQNFKNAFGNSKLVNPDGSPTIQYHGSAKKFDTFDESKFQLGDAGYSGSGIYTTPSKSKASSYALSSKSIHKSGNHEPTVYELYGQGNNPISSEDLIKQNKDYDLFNFHRAKNWQGDVPLEQQMLDYDVAIRNQTKGIERVSPWNDATELVFPTNRQLKSATGNNGMFNMSNPNIYKSIAPYAIPTAIGAGALQQNQKQPQYPTGGTVNTLEGDLISKVIMNRNRDKNFVNRAYALGQNPGMFSVQDPNEFGKTMSHKMAYGEDDNGQAYMYPTIMNPNNEAIKVPNQYADYISSDGYKKETNMEYGKGGYTVKRSSDRKGKTHVVIGPDGTKKYFGDPNLGERGKSKYGKDAFYARHKKNLDANPYFRAYARATWEEGGMIPEQGHISMNKRSLFKYGGLTVTDLNKYGNGNSNNLPKYATGAAVGATTAIATAAGGPLAGAAIGLLDVADKATTDEYGAPKSGLKGFHNRANALSNINRLMEGKDVGRSLVGLTPFGAISEATGLSKAIFGESDYDKDARERKFQEDNANLYKNMNTNVNWGAPQINTSQEMQFAQGGMVLDYNDPNANAELELQETFQMPNGQVGMVDGPSHENGGIAVDLPEGTRIWSDKLKYGGKTFAKHTKPITSKITRLEKEIEEAPINSEAKRNSVMLLNKQLDHYFDVQETNKEANEMKRTFKNGGMIKRADGSYSKRGLWDNIRANKGSGKKPTPQMLEQERKIKAKMEMGGYMYGMGGSLNMYQRGGRRLNLETPNNNMEQRWIKPEDNTPQSVNSFEYPVEPDFNMNNISEELYGNYGQPLPRPLMAATRLSAPPTMPPIERATGRYGEFVTPKVSNPNANIPFDQLPIGVTKPNTNLNLGQFGANANRYIAPENLTMGNVGKPVTDYRSMYENDPNIPKGQPSGSTAGAGMENLGFMAEPQGFFNNAGQFIQNNPGLIGQLGSAALSAGIQSGRVNRLARPKTLGDVRLSDKVVNPNFVDYSAERQAYNRMGLNAMDQAQRGFGSSAAAQAFKNKARLNTLEGTGKSYQSQENTNAQIRNAANSARQEAAMKEAVMNNEIGKYNLENIYGYDTMTTAQKNAITAMLANTAGQTFGKQTDYKNQMEQAKILSNQYDNKVYLDIISNSSLEDFNKRTPQEKEYINRRRTEKGLNPYGYGGMMKRSFRTGGTNNPGFNALPESVQENILNNMGMGGYMYSLGGRLMNDPMFAEGGTTPKNTLGLTGDYSRNNTPQNIISNYNLKADYARRFGDFNAGLNANLGFENTLPMKPEEVSVMRPNANIGVNLNYERPTSNFGTTFNYNPLNQDINANLTYRKRFAEGGKLSKSVLQSRLEAHMSPEEVNSYLNAYADGGIHIKPENKGKFTTYAKSHGKGVQEMAAHIMANKENYSPTIVKRANFAKNAAGWKHEMGGYIEYAEGGNVNPYNQTLNKVANFQTSKAAEQMDAEYAAALAANRDKYTSSVTGLDYKVLPKAEKRALVMDMWRETHGEAPSQKQIESGVKAIEGKKVSSVKAKEVANVANSQESMQDMISKKWTTGTYTPTAPEPEGPSMMERGEQFYEEQMLPAARTLKKNFKEGVEKGYGELKDAYGKAKTMGKQAYASLENAEYPDVAAGSRMDTRTKGEDAANSLPLPITMLSRDLFSKVKDRTITEKDLTKGELETLKMTLNGVKKATGRDYLKYADYDSKKGTKMSNLDLIREIVTNSDNQNLKYAFGQGNFRQEGDSTIFEDTYNFNDRNNQGYMDNVSNRLAKGDNALYAPFRALGTTYGSPEGQGNKVRVAMYNPKGKRSLKK